MGSDGLRGIGEGGAPRGLSLALAFAILGVVVVTGVGGDAALAQSRRDSTLGMPRPDEPCREFSVESAVALRSVGRDDRHEQRRVDVVLEVHVANLCATPLEVGYGSSVSYATNFPVDLEGGAQPGGCVGRRWAFSGTVPPHQRKTFRLHAAGCRYPLDQREPPRVVVESGRVVAPGTVKPIPAISKTLA